MKRIFLYSLLVIVFISVNLYSQIPLSPNTPLVPPPPPPPPKINATIINPHNGDSCKSSFNVNGIVQNIPTNNHLWLVVNPKGSNEWHRQFNEILPDKYGAWSSNVIIEGDDGKLFDIHLFLANSEANKYFEENKYSEQSRYKGAKSLVFITITKVSENRNPKDKILLMENFENERNLSNWEIENSGGDIKIIDDPQKGKVIKISRTSKGGNTFLKQDISRSVIGKKIRLSCQIKLEDVKKNDDNFGWGQLGIQFDYDDYTCYNNVQKLWDTKDWTEYKAVKDGRYNISNTGIESIIRIPEKATNVILYYGLQNTSGTIYFHDLKIVEIL